MWRGLSPWQRSYFAAYPDLLDYWQERVRNKHGRWVWRWRRYANVVVHHAVPRDVLNRYPGLFTADELDRRWNLRGIPRGFINERVHLSRLAREWERFYRQHPAATRRQILEYAARLDRRYGHWFRHDRSGGSTWDQYWRSAQRSRVRRLRDELFGLPRRRAGGGCGEASRTYTRFARPAFTGNTACQGRRQPSGSAKALSAPGGIDFSSLELRYVAVRADDGATGLDYAFRAPVRRFGGIGTLGDGLDSAVRASDAFFVWLAMPRTAFWVNLKPNEPDTIMDAQLARTRVGRVMLEADLTLKRTAAWAIHPRKKLGREFWKAIGRQCLPTMRQWITPAPATVHEDGDALYILDAPLRVQIEGWGYQPRAGDPGAPQGLGCPGLSEAAKRRILATYERIVLPHIQAQVNTAPAFDELRQIYLSRVAAEWYRERSEDGDTAFAGLVNSGQIDRWTQTGRWRPRQVFHRYVRSFTHGEYTATVHERRFTWTVQVGGVDLALVPTHTVSDKTFAARWPDLNDTVEQEISDGALDRATRSIWVGGHSEIDRALLEREFPDPATETKDDRAVRDVRALAPYAVVAFVLAGLALVVLAVVRGRRPRAGS